MITDTDRLANAIEANTHEMRRANPSPLINMASVHQSERNGPIYFISEGGRLRKATDEEIKRGGSRVV